MHEWLSGGVSPCQGEGRGFESRLALSQILKTIADAMVFFFVFLGSRKPWYISWENMLKI